MVVPRNTGFQVVVPGIVHKAAGFFVPISGPSGNQSLSERKRCSRVVTWRGTCQNQHPRACVSFLSACYPSPPHKSQPLPKCYTEGGCRGYCSWYDTKAGGWRWEPQQQEMWRSGDVSKLLQPRGSTLLWVH